MKSESEKHQVWFETVVQPKLKTLSDLCDGTLALSSFNYKAFFKEFLADLEMLALDNILTETKIEKISAAMEILKKNNSFDNQDFPLRDLALIAYLNNPIDKFLFFKKWKKYTNFVKANGPVDDESLVNAYRLSALIQELVFDIEQRALTLITETKNKVS